MRVFLAASILATWLVSDALAQTTMPATTPAGGSISIRAVQGTQDGPKVAGDEVTVELFGRGGLIRKIDTRLDEHGVVMVEGLELTAPLQPRATIRHAGVSYTAVGGVLNAAHPAQQIDVKVYEATDQPPAWSVPMRHLLVQPGPDGLGVTDILAVNNPADRAWLGTAGAGGERVSTVIELPAGATDLKLDGAPHSCCSKVLDGRLVNTMPLPPGMSQFRLSYRVPADQGRARVEITAPAPVGNLMVFLPDEPALRLEAEGLQPAGTFDIHGRPMRGFQAADLPAGKRTAFSVAGLGAVAAAAAPAANAESSTMPKVLAGVGGGLLLVLCVVILLVRPGRKPRPSGA